MAPQKLLTKEILKRLPKLYSQEKVKDPIVHVKFFHPLSNYTWYGLEFDGKDTFFGFVVGDDAGLGYFSLSELASFRVRGLGVERDMYFTPVPLSKIKAEVRERHGL